MCLITTHSMSWYIPAKIDKVIYFFFQQDSYKTYIHSSWPQQARNIQSIALHLCEPNKIQWISAHNCERKKEKKTHTQQKHDCISSCRFTWEYGTNAPNAMWIDGVEIWCMLIIFHEWLIEDEAQPNNKEHFQLFRWLSFSFSRIHIICHLKRENESRNFIW